jgi:hypothetical protein
VKQLHILNGDAMLPAFRESAIGGDIIVWREILSEGPVPDLPEEEFFRMRSFYIHETFGESADQYEEKVVSSFKRIENAASYDEIFLWFEQDLVCQINLLFLLHSLSGIHPAGIFVVKFYEDERMKLLKGFGGLSAKQLEERHQFLQPMNSSSLQFASLAWKTYMKNNIAEIEKLSAEVPSAFLYLKTALLTHLKKNPSAETGINEPERQLLKMLATKPRSKDQLVRDFLSADYLYGMTDLMIDQMISRLIPDLITESSELQVTEAGHSVLNGSLNFRTLKSK